MAIVATLPRTSAKKAPTITASFAPAQRGHGQLTLAQGKAVTLYHVSEFHAGRGYGIGRAFKVVKVIHDFDIPNEVYNCFLAKNPAERSCDCRGFASTGGCKHLRALEMVHAAGGLDAEDPQLPKAETFGEWVERVETEPAATAQRVAEIERALAKSNHDRLCGGDGLSYRDEDRLTAELKRLKGGA